MRRREDADHLVRALSAQQLGLFTYEQAVDGGLSRFQLATDVDRGHIERPYATVFAIAGIGWSPARRLLAATLAGGARAMTTHRAGAWLWSLTPYVQLPELSIPRTSCVTIPGVRVHRSGDLPDVPVFRLGVPTTDVNRVLIDLGAVLRPSQVRRALDNAIGNKHTNPMRVLAELTALAQRGRRGVGMMRAILDDAGVSGSHTPSVLEAKTRRLIRRAGLREPECELVAGVNGEYRLDFPYPEAMLNIEVDGWQYHSSFDAFHYDRTRQNALTIDGLAFLRYTWLHVTRTPDAVIREIRAAYQARTRLFS